ncbi:hypothetical protein [Paludisphaera rhizosphaerae]|uniref:hypothetical protein n=1 Tax=Paludisphaera rhizosphaerae TaxID=2711216 RepID=UPI0013ED5EC5|nr:hypothetical protein [Paludisphaera rhizosphaerae]
MRTTPIILAPALALVLAAGCGREPEGSGAPSYDSDQAKTTLVAALDAWKQGQAKSLPRRKPPIRFEDDDFAAGFKLTDYELEEPDATIGLHQDVPVFLSLRDKKGDVVNRRVLYQISTTPQIAVLRSDR